MASDLHNPPALVAYEFGYPRPVIKYDDARHWAAALQRYKNPGAIWMDCLFNPQISGTSCLLAPRKILKYGQGSTPTLTLHCHPPLFNARSPLINCCRKYWPYRQQAHKPGKSWIEHTLFPPVDHQVLSKVLNRIRLETQPKAMSLIHRIAASTVKPSFHLFDISPSSPP